jgi:phosphate transport system permease protein
MAEITTLKNHENTGGHPFDLTRRPRVNEGIIQGFLFFCGAISIITTILIVVILLEEAYRFFSAPEVNLLNFFTGNVWQPKIGEFGILPLLTATLTTTLIAMLVALPLGLCVAIYLSEYASQKSRNILKPILEILAGIPTIVYGYFALMFITPGLRTIFGVNNVQIYNTASAGVAMGILIIPLITTMTEDALSAVPRSLREAGYGLGATKFEVSIKIVIPAAISGIAAAVLIGFSRAIGETMIVAIAAGARPELTFNPFKSAETLTGYIVRISGGDLSFNSLDYTSIYALALVLFAITLVLNLISQRIVRHYRETYE